MPAVEAFLHAHDGGIIKQEITKHVDSANRTLGLINDIIVKRGKQKPEGNDALSEFRMV